MTLPETLHGRLDEFLARLDATAAATGRKRPRRGHGDAYMACCPAHDDKNPSLSIRLEGDRILAHCFAGCAFGDITAAVGMPQEALFEDYRGEPERQPRILWNGQGAQATAAVIQHVEHQSPIGGFDPEAGQAIPLPPTLTEFQRLEFPPIEPILGPFATQQLNLLFAPTGAGKTMLGLAVAYAIAEGQDFIGWQSSGPRRVLYVDGEMAARMMQERFSGVESENLWIANLPGWWADRGGEPVNLASESGQELLDFWVNATGADVIILDNFMSLAWRDGVSFSSDEIWSPLRRWMVAQRSANKTVMLVDHANAQGAVFGTKTKTHIMDLIGVLEPVEDGPEWDESSGFEFQIQGSKATLKWLKKRGFSDSAPEVNQKSLEIGPIGSDWRWENPEDSFVRQLRQLRKEGLSIREMAKELEVSYSKVQRAWRRVQRGDSGDSG